MWALPLVRKGAARRNDRPHRVRTEWIRTGAPRGSAVKGNVAVVRKLNEVLTNELTAINQYFVHAKMFAHWGFARLGKREHDASIDEMKHADALIARILFLEGLPNLQDLHKLYIGEDVKEALACDLRLELEAHPVLKAAVAESESCGDYVSRDLFRGILESEEEHIDWLETQLELIRKVGLENYQQSQMHADD
jgi:bacterioferritin